MTMSLPQPPETTDAPGPVPADNQPGHHPSKEQDKPDLTAFAQKLGVAEGPDTTAGGGAGAAAGDVRPGRSKVLVMALAAAAALLAACGLAVTLRRRSRR